jgi:hypothetical protein
MIPMQPWRVIGRNVEKILVRGTRGDVEKRIVDFWVHMQTVSVKIDKVEAMKPVHVCHRWVMGF